ncbi:MAG: DUF4149 domain-containing protein [Lentisphaeria bacterium]|jgi:uncharacterized membrane protein|nr:DUF4149 domain-containing protein [Lentisphaeria bacterium]
MQLLYLISVWIHIVAAAVWIGGAVFIALALVPVIRHPDYRKSAAALVQIIGRRFRTIGWACLWLMAVTGIINIHYRFTWSAMSSPDFWSSPTGHVLAAKVVLFGVILILSAMHDFWLGPKATALWKQAPDSDAARSLRRRASWIGRINLLLGLILVALGVYLVRS